jgi:hypothetical protein
MKHILMTVSGACWLLSSAGLVLANNAHLVTGAKGQPGTNGGTGGIVSCSVYTVTPGSGSGNGSPFNPADMDKRYAGNMGNPTGPGGTAHNSSKAVSEYDVACFQQTQHQMP